MYRDDPFLLEVSFCRYEVIEVEGIVIEETVIRSVLDLAQREELYGVLDVKGKSGPVKKVDVELLGKVFHQLNRTIRTATTDAGAVISHDHKEPAKQEGPKTFHRTSMRMPVVTKII